LFKISSRFISNHQKAYFAICPQISFPLFVGSMVDKYRTPAASMGDTAGDLVISQTVWNHTAKRSHFYHHITGFT
jgi:hypothetical protein